MGKLRKFWRSGVVRGPRVDPPNLAKISRKINGHLQNFENSCIFSELSLDKANFNKKLRKVTWNFENL